MDYSRQVSYLYSYNNGLKNKNVGFAKTEVRNDFLKLQINMKCAYADGKNEWEVYLYYRIGRTNYAVKLGTMKLSGGEGEFRYMGPADNLQESGHSFEETAGIIIAHRQETEKIFGGEWKQMTFRVEDICFDSYKPEPVVPVFEAAEIPAVEETKDVKAEEIINPEHGWEHIFDKREKLMLFADDDIFDCIEIDPSDISLLPNTNWGLQNNSFLNHGYYSFRHLILAKQRRNDGFGYVIGVPGIYTRRDKNTAAMFGFMHFKFSMRGDIHLSQFGYWYQPLSD